MPEHKELSTNTVRWITQDPFSATVSLYDIDFQHILEHHPNMRKNEDAIKETVMEPDSIYIDSESEKRRAYYRSKTSATYSDKLKTKVILEDESKIWTDARVVTAFPVKKEGESDVRKIYERSD